MIEPRAARPPFAGRLAALVVGVWVVAAGLVACGSDDGGSSGSTTAAGRSELPDGITGTVVLTRQRDLVDRGLINVLTTNDSGVDVFIHERRLETDGLDTEPVADRTIKVADSRRVAIQTPYGDATRCEERGPLEVVLAVEYTTSDDTVARRGEIPLDGTDVLDDIRARQCALAAMEAATDVELRDVVVDGEQVAASLHVELVDESQSVTVGDVSGTILMAADRADDGSSLAVDAARPSIDVPVVFSVNRCDPHALAEVTKRYGLDVDVTIDGREEVPVAVDVSDLDEHLETAVEACRARTGS